MSNIAQELASSETSVIGGGEDTFERAVFARTINDVGHQGKAGRAP